MKNILIALMLFLVAFTALAAEKPYTRNVAVVVYENAEPLDWAGPFEVWNDAASFGASNGKDGFHVYIVSKTTEPLNSQGLQVVPNYSIENAPKPDVLIIPGGQSSNLTNDPAFFAWTKKAAEEAEIVQTVCTGALVLARAGMLDNLEVTTWYGAIGYLRDTYPKVTVKNGRRFVDNGKIVTTAGISAGIDGSLHLVARLLGRRVADQVARYMEYHWTPEPYLSVDYRYLNPSTDEQGRLMQSAEMQRDDKNFKAAAEVYRSIVKSEPENGAAWFELGRTLRELDDHAGAANAYVRAAQGAPDAHRKGHALYNAACEYALADHVDDAVASLQKAVDSGFADSDQIRSDPDLAKLRADKRVQGMLAAR